MALGLNGSGTITGLSSTQDGLGLTLVAPTSIASSSGSSSISGGTVTFTGVSSISLNGCFSSTYENYKVLLTSIGSTTQDVYLRLRAAGTDDSGANYAWTNDGTNLTGQTSTIISINEALYGAAQGDIFGPALARSTVGISSARRPNTSTRQTSWNHSLATAYDGMTLYTSTGTMTGTLRVYGYRN